MTGGGQWWEITFETPRISFVPPKPGEPSHEQAYHASHSRMFHDTIARAREPLDALLASVAKTYALVPLTEPGSPLWLMSPMTHASGLRVAITRPLSSADVERLSLRVFRLLSRIERRRPEDDAATTFHLLRWPDGTIEDHGGTAPGWAPPADLPAAAASELVRRCAEIVAAAEREGPVHTDLLPDRVRLDDDGTVAIAGYGECRRPPRIPGAPDDFYEPSGAPAPDWLGLQRRGLGLVARHHGVDAGESPDPRALAAQLSPSDALDDWRRAEWGEPFFRDAPRGRWRIEERLAHGASGVLRPCQRCAKPTVLGSCMSSVVGGLVRPICRRCVDRAARRDELIVRMVIGGVVSAVIVGVLWAVFAWR